MRSPIQRMTFTAMLFPSALYRGPSQAGLASMRDEGVIVGETLQTLAFSGCESADAHADAGELVIVFGSGAESLRGGVFHFAATAGPLDLHGVGDNG